MACDVSTLHIRIIRSVVIGSAGGALAPLEFEVTGFQKRGQKEKWTV